MRNVSPCCIILAMWHIILILWRVGWRLNRTPSPSIMWRCTTSPFSRTTVLLSIYRSEISPPVFFSRIFAPGYTSGPLRTSCWRKSRFRLFTTTGFVIFIAIFFGTPSSRMDKLGSGVITDLAEKSTRFPIKLPLTRPPFPLRRSFMDLSGRPDRCATGAQDGILLSTWVAIKYCNRLCQSSIIAEFTDGSFIFSRSVLFALIIFTMVWLISSSLRWFPSILIDGRTAGGGIASTWQINQSGLENCGLNPINATSWSDILLKIFKTTSGVIFIFSFSLEPLEPSSASPSHSAKRVARFSFFIFLGTRQPHPSWVSSPHLLTLLAKWWTWFQRSSAFMSMHSLLDSLLMSSLLHFTHTHFKSLIIVGRYW